MVLYPLPDQPCNVPVRQLGRITLGLAGDGLDAHLVNLPGGSGGEHQAELQLFKQYRPERVILIHIQDPGDSQRAPYSFLLGKRFIIENPVQFIFKQVRDVFFIFFLAQGALTAVAGDKLAVAGEPVNGQQAVVGTSAAPGQFGGELQMVDLVDGEHGGLPALVAFPGDQGPRRKRP